MKATLVLRKFEISSLQKIFRQMLEENKKLRSDNKDANRRAAMLAQEIDERHASLEDSTKSEIRLLEQRHSEDIRELTSQLVNEREHWSQLNAKLEARIKHLEQEENRLKTEIQSVNAENSALENEQVSLQKQITELLETNIKLNNEIVDLEDKQRNDDSKNEKDEEVLELVDKITSLQVENANLRDKNDELAAEIEGLNIQLSRIKMKKNSRNCNGGANAADVIDTDIEQTCCGGTKRRGDSPSKIRTTEESPRLGKLRKCNNDDNNSESDTSGDWVGLNSEMNSTLNNPTNTAASYCPTTPSTSGFSQDFSSITDSKDEEIRLLKDKISKLEAELEIRKISKFSQENKNDKGETEKNGDQDGDVIDYEIRCQELENSLEQMRKAYEDCEDYWEAKLNEERQLFEKERQIYEEEQQENDKKFTELMEKIREYEEQFDKEGRLSPIEEKDNLEQQYADLEAEVEEIKKNAQKMFEDKTKEIIDLQEQIKKLKSKLDNRDIESPASSPINYLWNQSTIQVPTRDYQNPNWNPKMPYSVNAVKLGSSENLCSTLLSTATASTCILPIQRPNSQNHSNRQQSNDFDETVSNASGKSYETHSVASTHSIHKSSSVSSDESNPNVVKEELKKLKYVEVQLKEQIKDLAHQRDGLVMQLQQLNEAKPVLEKAYARTAHPSLIQRVNHLEQKNRHLQTVIRQQQQYTESIMHQNWQQQRQEIIELRNRLEQQGMLLTQQAQRLANADILVKDLYVENSHLTATIQRLEQQRNRTAALMHQHQGLTN